MRRPRFRLSRTVLRRLGAAAVVLVQAAWVILGRGTGTRLQSLQDRMPNPFLGLSGWLEERRIARTMQATSLDQAQAELDLLRNRLAELNQARMYDGQRLAEADEAIRTLGLQKALPLPGQRAARVLVNRRKTPFGGLLINLGQSDGLASDQGVICPEGVVGRIWALGPNRATVMTLDAAQASTAVMLGRSKSTGILQGSAKGLAMIRYIPPQEAVQVGEPVYTSGLDEVFPRGLLVGWVSAVAKSETELLIDVSLAAPLDRLGLVTVLPPAPRVELPLPGVDLPQPRRPQ